MGAECLGVDRSLFLGSEEKLMEVGLFVAAHKVTLYPREVKRCGKLYSGTGVRDDSECIRGLVEMQRPETVGELMQFLQAGNWMRLSLPNMAGNEDSGLMTMLKGEFPKAITDLALTRGYSFHG